MFNSFRPKKVEKIKEEIKEQEPNEEQKKEPEPKKCCLIEEKTEMVFKVESEIDYYIKVLKNGRYYPKAFLDRELNDEIKLKVNINELDTVTYYQSSEGFRFVDPVQEGFFDLDGCLDYVIEHVNQTIFECIHKVTKDQVRKELIKRQEISI